MSNAAREVIINGGGESNIPSAAACKTLIDECVSIAQNGSGNFTPAEKDTLGANFDQIIAWAVASKNSLMIVED